MLNYQKICVVLARNYFVFGMYVTLLVPLPRLTWLTTILRLGWLTWLVGSTTKMLSSVAMNVYEKVSSMVGNVLFIFHIFTNVATILEVMLKEKQRRELLRLEREVDELLEKHVDTSGMASKVYLRSFRLILVQTIYDIIHLAIAFQGYRSPVFFHAVPLMIVQRMRYVEVILAIHRQTQRSSCMVDALQELVRANRSKFKYTSDVWQPYTLWEYEHMNALRQILGRLYVLHKSVSKCYGWSIMVLLFTTFSTLVCNFFWCFRMVEHNFEPMKLLYNMMSMLRLGTLVVTLLVFGDRARRINALISGLIYKLAKPFGNETYNELVSSFSLQCLHEGLRIDVKGFVTLDLTLLQQMIASTVTYLIILVQFMGSEGKTRCVNILSVNNKSEILIE